MAVLVLGAAMLLSSHAAALEPDPDAVHTLAAEAAVDPNDLLGALVTVGEDNPRRYLERAGHLAPARPAVSGMPYGSVWDRLADCESDGQWHINSRFDGGLQFLPSTWTANKPAGYPAFAYQASREQQIHVAQIVQARYGWGQWPTCSRRLGLR
jgi:Transglycosylase-like domain